MRSRTIAPSIIASNPLQSLISRRWRPQWICQHCKTQRQTSRRKLSTVETRQASSSFITTDANSTSAEKPYYITTPIFYVNADPHVGHMYTMVLADVLKRWQALKGRKAILLTGTDEHGMKIQRAAAKAGMPPKEFCDSGADVFKSLAQAVDMSNDIFIRTTDQKHREGVEYAWQMLQERGYIYKNKHEGWYSVSDETFYPQSQVQLIVDPPTGRKIMSSIETGKEVEWTSERNYHFRLSAFKDKLLKFYEQNPDYITPKQRMAEVLNQVKDGLEDLSISRPTERLSWGVTVPTDPSQTIYVWLDALLNYATAVGYPFTPGRENEAGWPADVQVIGKDIIRFHCIYWPAFMMALDLPLHKRVLTHAHWTLGKEKMAKSTGNVVNPFFALERFGVDTMRWYLIHEGGIKDDADYDNSFIIQKYKSFLQDGLGNLTNRVTRPKAWSVRRAVKRYAAKDAFDKLTQESGKSQVPNLLHSLAEIPNKTSQCMEDLMPNRALNTIMQLVRSANAYFQHSAPWSLADKIKKARNDETGRQLAELDKDYGVSDGRSLELILEQIDQHVFLAAEALRLTGIMLQPFMPSAATRLLDMLGVADDRRSWEWVAVGSDDLYGTPFVDLGIGSKGQLFPGLTSEW